jgi:toxin ParE1/3/4
VRRFEVRWAQVARDDLDRIIDFIANDAPLNARKVLDRIEFLARTLETFPQRGNVVPELARHGVREWLELTTRPWRLVYRVAGKRVEIVALVDGRRRLEDLLFERLMQAD